MFFFDTIKVFVTSYCNLNCKHCYQHYEKNKYQLPDEKIFEIVDFACSNNTNTLDFSGGEFFTHPSAYKILDYCFSKRIKVNVATNATIISLPFFKKYKDSNLLSVQISVDGLSETHNERRGNGTYEIMIENAKALFESGIPLTASMALDEKNYLDALEVLNIPYFSSFILLPVANTGAAKDNYIRSDDYEETIAYLLKSTDCGEGDFKKESFPKVLAIKYDGKVYPSPVASDFDLLCFGNIYDDSIERIVNRFCESKEFCELSSVDNSLIKECNSCDSSKVCNRGCRFRTLKFFGELLKPDPFYCRIFESKYSDIPLGNLFWGIK